MFVVVRYVGNLLKLDVLGGDVESRYLNMYGWFLKYSLIFININFMFIYIFYISSF